MPEIYLAFQNGPRQSFYRASTRWWETKRFLEHGMGVKVLYLVRVRPH